MKKFLIISFFVLFLFSLTMIVSADAFPNSVVNLLDPMNFYGTDTLSGVHFKYSGSGYYVLNGTATSDIIFRFYTRSFYFSPKQLFILYGGTDNSQVSIRSKSATFNFSSGQYPSIISFPAGNCVAEFYIFVPKGAALNNVTVKPFFASFNYTVYDYGTSLDGQTDIYYNQGYSAGFSEGFFEGKTEGYELGADEGFNEGYKAGKGEGYDLGANSGEMVGYIDGYKNGYTNYKISTEYANALKSEYSSGFKEGAASAEAEKQDNALTVLIPMLIIDGVLCLSLIFFKSRRRRKNK